MKKTIFATLLAVLAITLINCSKAAEDRFEMQKNAKRISDSIGKTIDDAMAEVAIPAAVNATITDTVKK